MRLSAALDWADEHGPELNQLEREFLDESSLASASEQVRQRRANRRLRTLLALALVLLVMAVVGAGIALQKRGQARREATSAEAQRLEAQAQIEPALDRSLLLAREGVNLDDSLVTRSNLPAALLRSPAALAVAHANGERVLDEALSQDGRTLAARGDHGSVVFFDARTLRRLGTPLPGSDQLGLMGATVGPLHALAFSPDGRTIAVGSTTGNEATLDLVDARTHATLRTALDLDLHTADVAFSPDGETVATGEPVTGQQSPPDEDVVLRSAKTDRTLATSTAIAAGRLAGYTRDGRFLLVTQGDRNSLLLDAHNLKSVKRIGLGGAAALSPTDDEAAFGHGDGSVTLLDLRTGRQRTMSGREAGSIETVSFSTDGTRLATGAEDGTVAVWDRRAGLDELFKGHSSDVREVVFSPDGQTLYTASYDGSVIAWDVGGRHRLGQPFRYTSRGGGGASAVSPDGLLFAVSPGPDRVTLWRSRTLAPLSPPLRGPAGDVNGLAFSPDGKLVAAAGSAKTVLWDATTKKIVRVLPAGSHGASKVVFSPDGLTVAIGRSDGIDALVDLRTGKETAELATAGSADSVDYSPDGRLLASARLTGTTTVWDVARRSSAVELPGAIAAYAVRFSPDGKLVAVGDSSGKVALWDSVSGRPVGQPLIGHGDDVESIDFDPSGKLLVTANGDGQLRLWDVSTRKLIGSCRAPTPGGSVRFFPDGKHVLGVFGSGTGVVWSVDPATWKAKACSVANRELTRAEWAQFLPDRGYRSVCP
jgi:WD40 repeat protein